MVETEQEVIVDDGGGEQADSTGDTADEATEAMKDMQQLAGLPPMIGQDGKPLIVPIKRARDL